MIAYYLKLHFFPLIAFFAIDMVWLDVVARTFYRKYPGFLMAASPNWIAENILFFVVHRGYLGVLRFAWAGRQLSLRDGLASSAIR